MRKYFIFIMFTLFLKLNADQGLRVFDHLILSNDTSSSNFACDQDIFVYIDEDIVIPSASQKIVVTESNKKTVKAIDKSGKALTIGIPNSYKLSGYMDPSYIFMNKEQIYIYDSDTQRLNVYSKKSPYKFEKIIDLKDKIKGCRMNIYNDYLFASLSDQFFVSDYNTLNILRINKKIRKRSTTNQIKSMISVKEDFDRINGFLDETVFKDKSLFSNENAFDSLNDPVIKDFYAIASGGAYTQVLSVLDKNKKIIINNYGEKLYLFDDQFNCIDSLLIEPIKQIHSEELNRNELKNSLWYSIFTNCNNIFLSNKSNVLCLSYILSDSQRPDTDDLYLMLYYDLNTKKLIKKTYSKQLLIGAQDDQLFLLESNENGYQIVTEEF